MPRKVIINRGSVFQVIMDDDSRWHDGDMDITYHFCGNTRERDQDVDLLNALWDVLEEAFKDSGAMKMEVHPGDVKKVINHGRRNAQNYAPLPTIDIVFSIRARPAQTDRIEILFQRQNYLGGNLFPFDIYLKPFLATREHDPKSVENQMFEFVNRFKLILNRKLENNNTLLSC